MSDPLKMIINGVTYEHRPPYMIPTTMTNVLEENCILKEKMQKMEEENVKLKKQLNQFDNFLFATLQSSSTTQTNVE